MRRYQVPAHDYGEIRGRRAGTALVVISALLVLVGLQTRVCANHEPKSSSLWHTRWTYIPVRLDLVVLQRLRLVLEPTPPYLRDTSKSRQLVNEISTPKPIKSADTYGA